MKSDIQYESTGPARRINSIIEAYFKFRESAQIAQQQNMRGQPAMAEATITKQSLTAKGLKL